MKNLVGNFVHLHTHTPRGSTLDSVLKIDDMVNFAKNHKQNSIAITNHGKMHDYVDFYKTCIKNKIKPIIGNEIYEVESLKGDTSKRFHLVLLAKNQKGLVNLYKISSDAHTKFFYYKPIIDLEYIKENNLGEGLICLTACQAGRMSKGLVTGKDMKPYYDKLNSIFDYVALEIQSHDTKEQLLVNKKIIEFAKKHNAPYVVTCDAHMLNRNNLEVHGIFVEIGQDREVGESYSGCYLQTEEDIYNTLGDSLDKETISKAINETYNISQMIELVDIGLENDNQMPIISKLLPEKFNNIEEWYDSLIQEGYKKRKHDKRDKDFQKARLDRLEEEKCVLKELGYLDYFIMCYLLLKEARKRKIPIGYGRGSVGGCLSAYYMYITEIDSITWDLDFSRFANLGRRSMADVDIDISKRYRKEMIKISKELFGEEYVAPICTFNTLSTKVAIRDIGKVLNEKGIYNIPYVIRDKVAKMIPTIKTLNDLGEEEEKDVLLRDILFQNKELERYYKKFPKWFKYVMELEGLPKSLGQHAAGVIISPKPIVEYCPLCLNSDKEPMLQLEMHNAMDDIGLIKMDFLGLKSLDVVDDALKFANLTWDDIDLQKLDTNDNNIFQNIYQNGNTSGIFQMESYEASKMCMECKVDSIEDVIAVNAFNRPGTKDNFPQYVQNKLYNKSPDLIHEDLGILFAKTYSVLLYQEQTLGIFRYAKFPEEEVDLARRAIGHKEKNTMEKLKVQLVQGLKEKNWQVSQIEKIWNLILKQAEYSFNRSHSVEYGLLSYVTAWLKYYYPLEFMTSLMNNEFGNYGKLFKIINEANSMKIKIKPPHINKANKYFSPNKKDNSIIFGLSGVKGLGKSAVDCIASTRPYKSFKDLVLRSGLNKTAIIALIKAGAFGTNKGKLFKEYFEITFNYKKFKPRKQVTPKELREKCGIEIPTSEKDYKQKRVNIINKFLLEQYENDKEKKHKEEVIAFQQKYMLNKHLWEFETLSMFLTHNPFEKARKYLGNNENVQDGDKITDVGIIVDIDKKKNKKGQQYAFVEFYNGLKVIELALWAHVYGKYRKGITKSNIIVIIGKKNGNVINVEDIKPYNYWMKEKGL